MTKATIAGVVAGMIAGLFIPVPAPDFISPIPETPVVIAPTYTVTPTPTASPTPTPEVEIIEENNETWIGKVSHYSRAGCLGCRADLLMRNGEPLDDSRPTIAFNWLPMDTKVKITNLDNGKSIEAIVTDTGGFNRLGRIADLTPAVYQFLETKTDVSNVKIEVL